jgi:hypothetical protein
MAIKMLKDLPNTYILNVQPLFQRMDAHPGSHGGRLAMDCMHFCMPGPLELASTLLYNLIVMEMPR